MHDEYQTNGIGLDEAAMQARDRPFGSIDFLYPHVYSITKYRLHVRRPPFFHRVFHFSKVV